MTVIVLSLVALACSQRTPPGLKAQPQRAHALTSDCTGVVPDAAALSNHYFIVQSHGASSECIAQDGDGSGAIATATYSFASDNFVWRTRDEASGEIYGYLPAPYYLLAQNDGFMALTGQHPHEAVDLVSWNEDGSERGRANILAHIGSNTSRAAVDPTGGALVVASQSDGAHWTVTGQLFDDYAADNSGLQTAASGTGSSYPTFVGAGVDLSGNALVTWDGRPQGYASGTLLGVWMDQSGTFLTPQFVVATGLDPAYEPRFFPLADQEGLALENAGHWRAQIRPLSTTPEPPPAFLAVRPDHDFRLIHNGDAYAVWSTGHFDNSPCEQRVETFASAGNACGQVSLRSAPGICGQDRITVTRDGTAIDLQQSSAPNQCRWKVFPLLFN